jgi:hypothetical protein
LADIYEKLELIPTVISSMQIDGQSQNLSFSQYYRLVYVDSTLSEHSLWRVSLEYLLHCGPHAKHLLELVISHIPLDSETKNRKIISFCETNGLKSSKLNILLVLGKRALDAMNYGEAGNFFLITKFSITLMLAVTE